MSMKYFDYHKFCYDNISLPRLSLYENINNDPESSASFVSKTPLTRVEHGRLKCVFDAQIFVKSGQKYVGRKTFNILMYF